LPNPYNATVAGREDINPQLMVLRVRPHGPPVNFKPGQFSVLGLLGAEPRVPEADAEEAPVAADKMIKRAYSIASASVEQSYLEFYLTLVNSGQLTPRLFALKYGRQLYLSPKATGVFTLDRVPARKAVVLIATGTGLAPYMSMLRTLLITESKRKFVVLHGARHSWDLGYRAELESLARIRPNFTYLPAITRPQDDPHFLGATGRIQTLLTSGILESQAGLAWDPELVEVFLCGHPEMISQAKELFLAKGFTLDKSPTPGSIHVEEYW